MDIIYRSNDGLEFSTADECANYEKLLKLIIEEFTEVGPLESSPGERISSKIGVRREFLPLINLLDPNLEIVQRLNSAQILAANIDDFIALGSWLKNLTDRLRSI